MSVLDSTIAAAWLTAAFVQIALVIVLCGRNRAILPATHTFMFALFLPLLGAGNAILSGVPGCDAIGFVGAAIGATTYVALILVVTRQSPSLFSTEAWIPAIRAIRGRWIVGSIAFWILVKCYLFATYGVVAVRAVGLQGQIGGVQTTYAYWETIINAVATIFLEAAIFLGVLRMALRVERVWISGFVVLALIGELVLGDIAAGARRTILALAIVYCLTGWWAQPQQRRRLMKEVAIALCVFAAVTVYYPYVRANILNPEIHAQLLSGDRKETTLGMLALFVPDRDSVERGRTPILREGPMEFLCRLTQKQGERLQLTWGAVTGAALYTSIPSVLLANKLATEPDEVMAESYDLLPANAFIIVDLATSPLAQLQSDFGPAGWFLAPMIYGMVFMVFAAVFVSGKFSVLTRLLALGALWSMAASPEATLTTAASGLRDFVLFAVLVELVRRVYVVLRRSVVAA